TFLSFEGSEQSKIFPNAAFGYWKVTVERPLRLTVDLGVKSRDAFRKSCGEAGEEQLAGLIDKAADKLGAGPHNDFNVLVSALETLASASGVKLTAKRLKLLQNSLAQRDESAERVIKKVHRSGKTGADPLRGLFEATLNGKHVVVEYEPDTELRDTEQIPLLEEGGIESFIRREVLPHAPDAWIDESSVKVGYEISFTRYFYKPQPMRSLEDIRADILELEKETDGLLAEIIGEGNA
ncbi:MAG TPA: SAM-dependent DNA methyltransferase, partial [Methanomethylovorans sp.]|nr:SAM-dependent DNA methyltransferase [Methanomethylovorans sp.]